MANTRHSYVTRTYTRSIYADLPFCAASGSYHFIEALLESANREYDYASVASTTTTAQTTQAIIVHEPDEEAATQSIPVDGLIESLFAPFTNWFRRKFMATQTARFYTVAHEGIPAIYKNTEFIDQLNLSLSPHNKLPSQGTIMIGEDPNEDEDENDEPKIKTSITEPNNTLSCSSFRGLNIWWQNFKYETEYGEEPAPQSNPTLDYATFEIDTTSPKLSLVQGPNNSVLVPEVDEDGFVLYEDDEESITTEVITEPEPTTTSWPKLTAFLNSFSIFRYFAGNSVTAVQSIAPSRLTH